MCVFMLYTLRDERGRLNIGGRQGEQYCLMDHRLACLLRAALPVHVPSVDIQGWF